MLTTTLCDGWIGNGFEYQICATVTVFVQERMRCRPRRGRWCCVTTGCECLDWQIARPFPFFAKRCEITAPTLKMMVCDGGIRMCRDQIGATIKRFCKSVRDVGPNVSSDVV
jgi:hypothetical protein